MRQDSHSTFEQRVHHAVRHEAEQLPPDVRKKLDQAREQALRARPMRWQLPSAIAAGVVAAIIGVQWHQPSPPLMADAEYYWQLEPELLSTMDMLAVMVD